MTRKNFVGAAKRIDDLDIPRIGHRIGVGEDEIHAFMEVESAGTGFDSLNRPKMLFEPHIFYRILGPGKKRDLAVARNLAYPKWGTRPYPANSYPRLADAIEIDETAALKSASWGLGQILGDNHQAAGYKTVQDMVKAFMEDEENHLNAMISFLIAKGIDDDLRLHRWENVARVYNGPGYAKHNYHGRLAAAFAKWKRIKDTPWKTISAGQPSAGTITTAANPTIATPTPAPAPVPAPEPAPSPVIEPPVEKPSIEIKPDKTIAGVLIALLIAAFGFAAAWISGGN